MKKSYFSLVVVLAAGMLARRYFVSKSVASKFKRTLDRHAEPDVDGIIPSTRAATQLELTFLGDYAKFSPVVTFNVVGYPEQAKRPIPLFTSDGTIEKDIWEKDYQQSSFNTVSVKLQESVYYFYASIFLDNPTHSEGFVTIKGNVYWDGNLIKTYTQKISLTSESNDVGCSFDIDGFTINV